MKAIEVLRRDHAVICTLIEQLIDSGDDDHRWALLGRIATALEIHARIEEELFYPPLAALSGLIPEARREHAQMRALVRSVEQHSPASPDFIMGIGQLRDALQRHVGEEEGSIFAQAEQLGSDVLEDLGRRLEARLQALIVSAAAERPSARKIA